MTEMVPHWRTSSRSNDDGNCVEVADNVAGVVLVRDSKDRSGAVLAFRPDSWRRFVRQATSDSRR